MAAALRIVIDQDKLLEQGGNRNGHFNPALPEMPGFDDGMVDMRELIRTMAESPADEIMRGEQGSSRNGYRERTPITSVGPIGMGIPKVRMGSYLPDGPIGRRSRTGRAVIGAVSEMVAKGASTRKAERIASRMGIPQMSASQAS